MDDKSGSYAAIKRWYNTVAYTSVKKTWGTSNTLSSRGGVVRQKQTASIYLWAEAEGGSEMENGIWFYSLVLGGSWSPKNPFA